MAAINDLIAQIEDSVLRDRIQAEVNRMNKQKKFGLVFEEHLPEYTPLYEIPVKRGSLVAKKSVGMSDTYTVQSLDDSVAKCFNRTTKEIETISVDELVSVAEFGDPIYPYLKPLDTVCNAPDNNLWHTLIEADNYHALQLLEYLYIGKVDCIYIDPPYNTGAKDWKYNNDYVDSNDAYRHSKWLSFMEKRLKLAKKLLNPNDSVLIVTIDEKEYLHLGCLLEELFPYARIQMISDVINPAGTMQRKKMPRTDEYIFFVWIGEAEPNEIELEDDWLIGDTSNTNRNRYRWCTFVRTASNVSRSKTPSMFYPIFVDESGHRIISVGDPLERGVDYKTVIAPEGQRVAFPINTDGREVIWHLSKESLISNYEKGYIKLGGFRNNRLQISYLPSGMQAKIENGEIPIVAKDESGAVIFDATDYKVKSLPGTQWRVKSHNATEYGTKFLQKFIGMRFSYPKSLYSVKDDLKFYLNEKKNALIIDFFAGSGTTLHAVNLLNAEDGGHRRCILVTNNEVSEAEAKNLTKQGFKPGDKEWEDLGIARYVAWPRTVCSIEGHDINGNPIKGNYLGSGSPMAEGFKANVAFLKLSFLDKNDISLGRNFKELIPLLWLKAGSMGPCPTIKGEVLPNMLIFADNRFAVLVNESSYMDFIQELDKHPEIDTIFFITDSNAGYRDMIVGMEDKNTYQLYRDYLDNFRINTTRR